jgi:hypothetical protein
MKTRFFLILLGVTMSFLSCAVLDDQEAFNMMPSNEKERLKLFEKEFVAGKIADTRSDNPDAIQLLGFTSVEYFGEEKVTTKAVWEKYAKEIADTKFTFTSYDGSFLRIYYPLHTATVTYKGKTYVADEQGVVFIEGVKDISDIRIVGRKASNNIVPTKGSVVKGGNIMFGRERSTKIVYKDQKTLVFDLGYRQQSCCKTKHLSPSILKTRAEEGKEGGGTVSCIENHGGQNCTAAFPSVSTLRCRTYWDRCMDYNGYGTDCSGSHAYFVGSDCSWAIAQGECWNEYM